MSNNTKQLRALVVCTLSTLALSACQDSGGNVGVESGTLPNDRVTSDATGGIAEQRGMRATVESANTHFAGDMHVTSAGSARNLKIVSRNDDDSYWELHGLPQQSGTYRCGASEDSQLGIVLQQMGMPLLSSSNGGNCEIRVEQTYTAIRGSFRALMRDTNGRGYVAEGGAFNIELAAAIPDLDADGVSDADDNCPFLRNPDQADANENLMGDACDPTSEQ